MKFQILLCTSISLLMANTLFSQLYPAASVKYDTIPVGMGNLEHYINGDTTVDGSRKNPSRVYVLKGGNIYIQNAPISVNMGITGTLAIIGDLSKSQNFPVILKKELSGVQVGENIINGSLTLKNIQYEGKSLGNTYTYYQPWGLYGLNRTLSVDNCLFEFCDMIMFSMNNVTTGCKIFITNCYMRNFFNGTQWWGGRMIEAKVPIDTLVYENNTSTGSGLLVLTQNCLINYAIYNHNTIINNIKYPFFNSYHKEAYFTNNLIVNGGLSGDDPVNMGDGGQDPGRLPMGIFGVDTINVNILIQPQYRNGDGSINLSLVGPNKQKIYVADNVIVADNELDDYLH